MQPCLPLADFADEAGRLRLSPVSDRLSSESLRKMSESGYVADSDQSDCPSLVLRQIIPESEHKAHDCIDIAVFVSCLSSGRIFHAHLNYLNFILFTSHFRHLESPAESHVWRRSLNTSCREGRLAPRAPLNSENLRRAQGNERLTAERLLKAILRCRLQSPGLMMWAPDCFTSKIIFKAFLKNSGRSQQDLISGQVCVPLWHMQHSASSDRCTLQCQSTIWLLRCSSDECDRC